MIKTTKASNEELSIGSLKNYPLISVDIKISNVKKAVFNSHS
jgi:hypothetical protein